jgi:hypothetical protein
MSAAMNLHIPLRKSRDLNFSFPLPSLRIHDLFRQARSLESECLATGVKLQLI